MNIPSECRTASIGPKHAMVLHHNANPKPDGIFGKDRCARPVRPGDPLADEPPTRSADVATRKVVFVSANKTLDTIKRRAARHGGDFGL